MVVRFVLYKDSFSLILANTSGLLMLMYHLQLKKDKWKYKERKKVKNKMEREGERVRTKKWENAGIPMQIQ